MAKSLSQRLTLPVFVLAWGWLIFHFAFTALYLAPVSHLKVKLYPTVLGYMDPWFRQRWSLFAPDPTGRTRYLQVACKVQHDDGSPAESPWYNVSERYLERTWPTRLGPGFRLHRSHKAPLLMLDTGNSAWFDVLEYEARSDAAARERLEQARSRVAQYRKEQARTVAQRIASAECHRQFPDAHISEVHAAFDIVSPLPFHERRGGGQPENVRIDFGWLPMIEDPGLMLARES